MTATISMPHRYCVHYDDGVMKLEFEVEPLTDGIVLYSVDPKFLSGEGTPSNDAADQVLHWLNARFRHVEVDTSPKPTF
jgi:hypothetical protein